MKLTSEAELPRRREKPDGKMVNIKNDKLPKTANEGYILAVQSSSIKKNSAETSKKSFSDMIDELWSKLYG